MYNQDLNFFKKIISHIHIFYVINFYIIRNKIIAYYNIKIFKAVFLYKVIKYLNILHIYNESGDSERTIIYNKDFKKF
jgi:hypothetical protein